MGGIFAGAALKAKSGAGTISTESNSTEELKVKKKKIIHFPQAPALSLENVDELSWEPALSYKLPQNPSSDLIERARQAVIYLLDYLSHEIPLGYAIPFDCEPDMGALEQKLEQEIGRAAKRLKELALASVPAMQREALENIERE